MNICLIQTDPEDGQHNLDCAAKIIGRYDADVCVLWELFTVGIQTSLDRHPQTRGG
jgi:hypothetical protein